MIKHPNNNDLITKEQHGFVRNKSCITKLNGYDNECFSKGHQTLVVFLDFQKAFHKVCHESLHFKLKQLGFCQELRNWIKSYLSGWKQRVVISDSYSEWKPVTNGVSQGSVLGPLLFVIFINHMPAVVNHIIKLFASHLSLWSSHLRRDITAIENVQSRAPKLVKQF